MYKLISSLALFMCIIPLVLVQESTNDRVVTSGVTFLSNLVTWVEQIEKDVKYRNRRLTNEIEMLRNNVTELIKDSQVNVEAWLNDVNAQFDKLASQAIEAMFDYDVNMTEHNEKIRSDAFSKFGVFLRPLKKNAMERLRPYLDGETRRQLRFHGLSLFAKNQSEGDEQSRISREMGKTYNMAEVCTTNNTECFALSPDLTKLMAESNDLEKLKWAWQGWRDTVGRSIRENYIQYVKLGRNAAHDNGYADVGEYWRIFNFGDKNIDKDAHRLMEELRPLYRSLFAFVRRRLLKKYGTKSQIDPRGPLPAHLLGNMWAQTFNNLINKNIAVPYPDVPSLDITEELKRQNATAKTLFKLAEEFFVSIGLFPMTEKFWEKSMIVKPSDRNVSCHATAYDIRGPDDYRIKMCTDITHEDFSTVHHEMGHIEYYMAYQNLKPMFRSGANSAFHEAIGDLISLSVDTVPHLKMLGFIKDNTTNAEHDYKQDINFLMQQALTGIAFLPFGYLVDAWRWKAFSGDIQPHEYNRRWWEMRLEYQGMVPPVNRSEKDFDPGAKYHVAEDVPYLRYFFSRILTYQFYEAMCKDIHSGPLYKCDFYGSKVAGKKLKNMLELGESKPWPDALEVMTGQRDVTTDALFRYFEPLMDWLKKENGNDTGEWLKQGETSASVIDKYFL